jgi:hypothetical protein
METLFRDVRLSLKRVVKERKFSATVLLTLAVCIGANVTIFSDIQTVLLQPLPFYPTRPARHHQQQLSRRGCGARLDGLLLSPGAD